MVLRDPQMYINYYKVKFHCYNSFLQNYKQREQFAQKFI